MPATYLYVTSFCNQAHRLIDGKPVAHECFVIPPRALEEERAGHFDKAHELIEAGKTSFLYGDKSLPHHFGTKE